MGNPKLPRAPSRPPCADRGDAPTIGGMTIPEGAQISPDGNYYLADGGWKPIAAGSSGPPPVAPQAPYRPSTHGAYDPARHGQFHPDSHGQFDPQTHGPFDPQKHGQFHQEV